MRTDNGRLRPGREQSRRARRRKKTIFVSLNRRTMRRWCILHYDEVDRRRRAKRDAESDRRTNERSEVSVSAQVISVDRRRSSVKCNLIFAGGWHNKYVPNSTSIPAVVLGQKSRQNFQMYWLLRGLDAPRITLKYLRPKTATHSGRQLFPVYVLATWRTPPPNQISVLVKPK